LGESSVWPSLKILFKRYRTLLFTVVAVILVWQIVSVTFANYLAEVAPETALVFNGHEPTALINLVNKKVSALEMPDRPLSPAHFREINEGLAAMTESALPEAPLDTRALRILGQLADDSHDETRARDFMWLAAQHSLQETAAIAWVLQNSIATRDYSRAIYYADVLLRTRPGLAPYVVPQLAHLAEIKEARADLKKMLSLNPPWRGYFFRVLPTMVSDARTPLDLFIAAKNTATPPISDDLRPYLNLLIDHKLYDLAYYTWLQFLPPTELANAGYLFNGNFALAPSGLPFDWTITPGSGMTIDRVRSSDESQSHALYIDFKFGRVDFHSITEMTMLGPGNYQFSAQYKGELIGPRGLKWRLSCANPTATPLGESPMILGKIQGWQNINFSFTVPAADCRPQIVKLDLDARTESEQLITGSVWFEHVNITRANP
jgi:hypothetical protein